jgi:hypothetical protein
VQVSFPRDKEDIEKTKMAAMLQKFSNMQGTSRFSQDKETRLQQINSDLTQFYRENVPRQVYKIEPKNDALDTLAQEIEPEVEHLEPLPQSRVVDSVAFGDANVFDMG